MLFETNRSSGWAEMSYTASSDQHSQSPMGFNDKANQFLLNQNWLTLDLPARPLTDDDDGPKWGVHADIIFPGSDYRYTLPRGLFNSQLIADNNGPNLYGIDPVQFYLEANVPTVAKGLNIKVGRFYAPWGVENVDAVRNALFSHAYTFVYDPFTQTGVLSTTKLNDDWTLTAGLVTGSDNFIDSAAQPTFCGNIAWAPKGGKNTLRFDTILGSARYDVAHQQNNLNLVDMIYTHQFHENLNYTFTTLCGYEADVPRLGFSNWLSVTQYLTRKFNDKLSSTMRLELFDDFQGQRTGFAGLYTAGTAGIAWTPCKRITLRPELRYDTNGQSRPFEDHHSVFTAAADLILRW